MPPSSSAYSSSSTKQETDPRPINDKSYQQKCIRELLDFLQERSYPYPLTQKSLSNPSSKDFSNIVTFMLRLFDPYFQSSTMKFEDEVALHFKCLGYPSTISKTSLVTAGSTNSWPSLLAALSWLMGQLKNEEQDLEEDYLGNPNGTEYETVEELQQKTEKAFYQYLTKSYTAYMHQDMAALESLENALSERFLRDDEVLEQDISRLTDVITSIGERIDALELEAADLPSYHEKRENYATDLEQFHDLIVQMDEHKTALEKKVKERSIEVQKKNEKLDKMTKCVEELKKTIANQDLSVDDVKKMQSEMKGLKESLDRASAQKEQRKKSLLAHENELVKVCTELETYVSEYNEKIAELQSVPEVGNRFAKLKASLKKQHLLEEKHSMIVGVDIENHVLPLIEECRNEYVHKSTEVKDKYQDELDRMDKVEKHLNEAESKYKIVAEKKSKSEITLENENETKSATITVRQREVDSYENKIKSLRDPSALEEQMAAYERQCSELEALRMQHEEENIAKKKAVEFEIREAFKAMQGFDKEYEETVTQVLSAWQKKTESVPKIVAPKNLNISD